MVSMYVDDLIVTGARTEDINSFKREMAARFRMSDLSYYLGVDRGRRNSRSVERGYGQNRCSGLETSGLDWETSGLV